MHHRLVDVDAAHLRQLRRNRGALRQREHAVTAALRVVIALQRRRRRTQHDRHTALTGAEDRHIARRITQTVLLFERAIMLLVHDDERQLGQLGEHRQTRAQHDLRTPALRLLPIRQACRIAQPAMQTDDVHIGETAAEIMLQLRREIDLRHQQQHLPTTAAQDMVHQMHIHLGLAAAGDAVQQETAIAAGLRDRVHRHLLLAREHVRVIKNVCPPALGGSSGLKTLNPTLRHQHLQSCTHRRRQHLQPSQGTRL